MNLPAGYTSRPAGWDDLDAIVALFNACDRADVGFEDPVRGHLEELWRTSTFDLSSSSLVVLEEGSEPIAYADVFGHNPSLSLDGYARVHPEFRGRGVGSATLDWIEHRAAATGTPKLHNAVPTSDAAARQLLERRGFAQVRIFWHMEIELGSPVPAVPPDGIAIRPYRHDADVRPVYDAIEEAFEDHWGHEPYPLEIHAEEMGRADPMLAPIATVAGVVVGAAVGRVMEGAGWIDVVGVRRAWRGRGIAKALLRRAFEGFASLGVTRVLLNVDAESPTGATRLYESLGMHVRRRFDLFEKRLRGMPRVDAAR